MIYEVGDVARLSAAFTNLGNAPTDPTTVSLVVQAPDGTQTTYTYAGAQVVRDGTGTYHYDLAVTQAGLSSKVPAYLYRWIATGAVTAVQEGSIVVAPTTLVPQPPANPPEWTWADLQTINAAIASGASEVRFQDRTIRYKSSDDLLKLRAIIWLYLHPGKVRQLLTFSKKGF